MIPRLLVKLLTNLGRVKAVYPRELLAKRRALFILQIEEKEAARSARSEQPVADEQGHLEGERKAR